MPVPTGQRANQQTDDQVAAHALAAGWTGPDLVTIIAVVIAESGGVANNYGDQHLETGKWGPSIGLAQVRSLRSDTGTGQARDATRLADPGFNLSAARAIFLGDRGGPPGWGNWTAHNVKLYVPFLPRARRAAAVVAFINKDGVLPGTDGADLTDPPELPTLDNPFGGLDPLGGLDGIAQGAQAIASVFDTLGQRTTWVRAAQVVGGGAFVLVALVLLNSDLAATIVGGVAGGPAGAAVAQAATS